MPETEICRIFSYSEKTLERDLRLGDCEWMRQHVSKSNIRYATAAKLLEAAAKHNREEELRERVDEWVAITKKALRKKNRQRIEAGKKGLSSDQRKPERYLKPDQVNVWLEALKTKDGDLDKEPQFRPLMTIDTDDKGVKTIEIGKLKRPVSGMSKREFGVLVQRSIDFSEAAVREFNAMEDDEELTDTGVIATSPGAKRLEELGYGEYAVSFDDDEGTDGEDDEDGFETGDDTAEDDNNGDDTTDDDGNAEEVNDA